MLFIGNWRQYCILNENETLSKYLLDTNVFKRKHLFKFLDLYKHIMIRPCFGYECVYIFSLDDEEYEVQSNGDYAAVSGKPELFDYLNQFILKDQQYMIQQLNPENRIDTEANEWHVTIHRAFDSMDWKIVGMVPYHEEAKLGHLNTAILDQICIQIGKQLGAYDPLCQTIVIHVEHNGSEKFWIRNTEPQFSSSKWGQYHTLKTKQPLHASLLDTEIATPYSLFHYLSRYKQVILKPCIGQWGRGVVQVTAAENDSYEVHIRKKKTYFKSKEDILHFLEKKYLLDKRHIIQKKVNLAKIDGNPFDVRVMVQKGAIDSPWSVTGRLAKVAKKDFIVTNVAISILPLEKAFERSNIAGKEIDPLINEIDRICLLAANHLGNAHENLHKMGFDIGINESGEVFIIEVNLKPDISMFYLLEDKTMHKTIMKEIRRFRDSL